VFYGTRRFITAFPSSRHLSLSWASSIQSIPPYPTSWKSILILSCHLCLGLPNQNPVYASPLLQTCYMPHPSYHLDFITRTILGGKYRSLSSSLCSFLYSPITSSLLVTNILLNNLFSNTTILRSSLNISWATKFHAHTKRQAKL